MCIGDTQIAHNTITRQTEIILTSALFAHAISMHVSNACA